MPERALSLMEGVASGVPHTLRAIGPQFCGLSRACYVDPVACAVIIATVVDDVVGILGFLGRPILRVERGAVECVADLVLAILTSHTTSGGRRGGRGERVGITNFMLCWASVSSCRQRQSAGSQARWGRKCPYPAVLRH